MLLRELFVKCVLFCLVMSFSSFAFADNGYWIQPNPEQPSSLDKQVGSAAVMGGKICAMKRIDNRTLQCGAIKDKNVQVFATFPDEMQDVSEQILIQKNANDWSYQFTTPALAADGNNTLTIIVGKFDKETRALLRTKARLQNTLVRIEQNIQALDPLKKNYQKRLAHFQARKTLIQDVIASIEENIDRNPDVLARYSRPIMVRGVVNGQHSHVSSFNHYKLSVSSDKGAYQAGESAQISGSVMLTKETKHTNGMNGRIELKLNNVIVANESGVQLALDVPRSISATVPNLISQLNPVELSFYNAREKIRVALPFELLVSSGTQNPMPIARISANKTESLTGEAIQFNAQGSSAGVGSIIDYTIDFGDGTISSGTNSSWAHSYASQGIYTARVTVTDSELNKASATTQVTVTEPVSTSGPLANFTYKVEPETGELVTFFQGRPGDAAIVSARYTTSDGQSADVAEIIWRRYNIFNLNPNMSVTLTVTDANGKTDSKTHTIIPESTPVVHLYWKDLGSRKAFFDFRDSFDTIDEIAGFEIDYGDGTITNFEFVDKLALHTYPAAGTYTVRLTAANYDDVEVSRTFQVTVTDLILPLAAPIASYEIGFPQNSNNVTFYLNQSIALSGSIVSVRWDYGDGTSYFGNDIIHAHYYDPGAYLATLTITDSNGSVSSQTQRIIIEDAGAPFIAGFFCNDTGGAGQISCESYVYDRDKDISEITVAWGDGTTQDIPVTNPEWMFILETNHTYQFAGTYNYTMTVKTNRGEEVSYSGSATVSGEVPNQAPVAQIFCTSHELTISCNSGSSFDPDGFITNYRWDMGNGVIVNGGNSISYEYTNSGAYEVSLEIMDNQGAVSNAQVLVHAFAPNKPPLVSINCSSNDKWKISCESEIVTFNSEIRSVVWLLDNTIEINNESFEYEFTSGGLKNVNIRVVDTNGLEVYANTQVNVLEYDPIPFANFVCLDNSDGTLRCDGNLSSSPASQINLYEWFCADEKIAEGLIATVNCGLDAIWSIKLRVTNELNKSSQHIVEYPRPEIQVQPVSAKVEIRSEFSKRFININEQVVFQVLYGQVRLPEEGVEENPVSVSVNGWELTPDEIQVTENDITIVRPFDQGANEIVISFIDNNNQEVDHTEMLFAGSRELNLDVDEEGVLFEIRYQDRLNKFVTNIVSSQGKIVSANIPAKDVWVIGKNSSGDLLISENDLTSIIEVDLSDLSIQNNDFTNDTANWEPREGIVTVSENVQEEGYSVGEFNSKKLVYSPSPEGTIEIAKAIKAKQDDTRVSFVFNVKNISPNDLLYWVIKSRSTGQYVFQVKHGSEFLNHTGQLASSSGWLRAEMEVDNPEEEFDVYFKFQSSAIGDSYTYRNLFSDIFLNKAFAQSATPVVEVANLMSFREMLRGVRISDYRLEELNFLSTGEFSNNPIRNTFVTPTNLQPPLPQLIGYNDLYFSAGHVVTPSTTFSEIQLRVRELGTNRFIGSIDLRNELKRNNNGNQFQLNLAPGQTNLSGRSAFRILSEQLTTASSSLTLELFVRSENSYQVISFGRPLKNLLTISSGFRDGIDISQRKYNQTWNAEVGGVDHALPSVRNQLVTMLHSTYNWFPDGDISKQNKTYYLAMDDAARKNGGYLHPHSNHNNGNSVDLNFTLTHLESIDQEARLFKVSNNDRSDSGDALFLKNIINNSMRKVILTYNSHTKSGSSYVAGSATTDFASSVYSTCLDDGRLMSEVLVSDKYWSSGANTHRNHIHIEFHHDAVTGGAVRDIIREDEKPQDTEPYLEEVSGSLGVYEIKNTQIGVKYRWLVEGDPEIMNGKKAGVLYPIEMLSSNIISKNGNRITMGTFGVGKYLKLHAVAFKSREGIQDNLARNACRAFRNIPVRVPVTGYQQSVLFTLVNESLYPGVFTLKEFDSNNVYVRGLFLKSDCSVRVFRSTNGSQITRPVITYSTTGSYPGVGQFCYSDLGDPRKVGNVGSSLSGNLKFGIAEDGSVDQKRYLSIMSYPGTCNSAIRSGLISGNLQLGANLVDLQFETYETYNCEAE